ncbi:MAG: MFS transporter, partial [Aquabacterium sp.]|nr:MFS transporter [Ferruginibacter sp.]
AVQQRIQAMQHSFINKGLNTEAALKSSYLSMDHIVTKQAAVLSYMDVFFYLGVIFLICVPFVLMVKGSKGKKKDMAEAMH